MFEPNYDQRLEPKRRQRTQEEIEDILSDFYLEYISGLGSSGNLKDLVSKLDKIHLQTVINCAMEEVFDQYGCGQNDKDFMKTVDLSALEWEES